MSLHRVVTLTARALRLRCPNCGGGPLFSSWFRMRDRCATCRLRLERGEQGYVVGAYNIAAAELLLAAIAAGVVVATWPSPPWTALQWGGAAFLAFDLMFRPAQPEDFFPPK